MIKNIIGISLIILMGVGCTKDEPVDDTIQPVITINGSNDYTISLNSTYTEPGATAQDNTDGDISSSIITTGTVNTNLTGLYHKYYDVADAQGNQAARATRNVYVVNDADFLIGAYVATANCGATSTSQYNTNITTSTTVNNEIGFSHMIDVGAILGNVVNGSSITIPSSTALNGVTYSGSGPIVGTDFTINFTSSANTNTCVINHVK